MAKTKKQNIERNADELQTAIADARKEVAKLAMDNAKKQLKQTTQLRVKRDELARLLTQMNMVKFSEKVAIDKKGDTK